MLKKLYYINPVTKEYLITKEIDTEFLGLDIPNTTEMKPLSLKDD